MTQNDEPGFWGVWGGDSMKKYKKRPMEVEAMQYLEGNPKPDVVQVEGEQEFIQGEKHCYAIRWGDWIVRGQSGNYYVCPDADFVRLYEAIE